MKISLFICLLISPFHFCFAQQSGGSNQILLSYTPQYYFARTYVGPDSRKKNPIKAHNVPGYRFALEYERVTRSGFLFDIGLEYGHQKHNVDIEYDLSNYHPGTNVLHGIIVSRNVSVALNYFAPRVLIGYQHTLNEKWSWLAKFGASIKLYPTGIRSDRTYEVSYTVPDSLPTTITSRYSAESVQFGNQKGNSSRNNGYKGHTHEFYIGAQYNLDFPFLKFISMGVEATYTWMSRYAGRNFIFVYSQDHWNRPAQYMHHYTNRDFSVGMRIGLGLWK